MKPQKKLSVSVGIPAYNEEKNIENLIRSILSQKQTNFNLNKIIITSDNSSDDTDARIKKLNIKNLILKRNSHRIGQALSQNIIKRVNKSSVLVLLNADTELHSIDVLNNLIEPFYKKKNIGIVGGKTTPLSSINLFENILYFSCALKQEIYEKSLYKTGLYLCHGRIRAFSKEFLSKLEWKKLAGEDAYFYLQCMSMGYEFIYSKKAEIFYRLPQNFEDHKKQSLRFIASQNALIRLFSEQTADKYLKIPKKVFYIMLIKYFIINPIYFFGYIVITFYVKIHRSNNYSNAIWSESISSKNLI